MTGPLIEVRDLVIDFPTRNGPLRAVDGMSLCLRAGETLGLVGESGSGKSVTALSLMRMVPPPGRVTGGSVSFLGRDLVGMSSAELRKIRGRDISLVFQDPMTTLNPVITVRKQVEEVIRAHSTDSRAEVRRRAADALGMVGIKLSRIDDYPHRFSGGMRQRVTIAMAIANRPKVLIADEPTTALDVTIQAQILSLLRDLNQELGTAVILISHNLGVIADLCQRVIVMYAGQPVEQSSSDAVFAEPSHPYTVGLLRSMPRLDADRRLRLSAIEGRPPDPQAKPAGCPFQPRCALAIDKCQEQRPPLLAVLPDHQAACWVTQESGTGTVLAKAPRQVRGEPSGGSSAGWPLVGIEGLVKHFPIKSRLPWQPAQFVHAVDGIDLSIERGSTLGLVGESGCGKSTVARVLVGIHPPTDGHIHFAGKDVTRPSRAERTALRRQIQMVFQDPYASLDPRSTVGDIIGEPLEVHSIARGREKASRVADLLDVVGLRPEFASRRPHEFSGGQRQRIGIARALALQPPFIILDEPLSSLDVSIQAQIVNLLQDLQSRYDLTYLLVAHDLAVVRHLSDRIAVMYLGRIVERGGSEEISARPLHPYTAGLLASAPVPEGRRRRVLVAGDIPDAINPPPGCRFHTRCPIGPLTHPERSICREVEPPLAEHEPGKFAACHFPGEAATATG